MKQSPVCVDFGGRTAHEFVSQLGIHSDREDAAPVAADTECRVSDQTSETSVVQSLSGSMRPARLASSELTNWSRLRVVGSSPLVATTPNRFAGFTWHPIRLQRNGIATSGLPPEKGPLLFFFLRYQASYQDGLANQIIQPPPSAGRLPVQAVRTVGGSVETARTAVIPGRPPMTEP
jgi:hypothetical protein